MGVRMAGTGAPADTGNIKRWVEARIQPNGLTDGAVEPLSLTGLVRFGTGLSFVTSSVVIAQISSNQAINRFADSRRWLKFSPTVAANCLAFFALNGGAVAQSAFLDWCLTSFASLPNFANPDGADFRPPSWSVSAWCRKDAAGDASHCQHVMGFANSVNVAGNTGSVPRAGLLGDGALGYRFGSVNCPDGNGGVTQNAAGDIDANSVQPADLVNPGTTPFHVRIKIIPPGPGQGGQWAAYLNGARVAVYSLLANAPRGHQGGSDNFARNNVVLGTYFDAGGVRPSLIYHDIRLRIEDDWSV